MRFPTPTWWPFRGGGQRQLLALRTDRLDGRPVMLAFAELPPEEHLCVEWDAPDGTVLVEGAWTGKAWVLEGPPEVAGAVTFQLRARAHSALRRAAGPQGGHLLATGTWHSDSH